MRYAIVIENAGPNFSAYVPDLPGCVATGATLEEVERRHVVRVLDSTGGHKARAAALLGISRPRLNRLLDKYGVR